jgi:uncharacterized protein YbcI
MPGDTRQNMDALVPNRPVREGRLLLQRSLEKDFRSVVEGVLGRRTLAFISGIDVDRDVAVEVFTLEP